MRKIILIVHDVRSCHNVGSLLRTADGLGVERVYLTGYTPYPRSKKDSRLPHLAQKAHNQIKKTALGAEQFVAWTHSEDVLELLPKLRASGYLVAAVEQTDASIALHNWRPPDKVALLIGREVEGVQPEVLSACDELVEIPMFGKKESFNVVQAAAMALYHCRFS